MKGSEFCSLDDGVDVGPTTSNVVDGPIVGRCTAMLPTRTQGVSWLDMLHGSICHLSAIAPLFVLVAATMAPPVNV